MSCFVVFFKFIIHVFYLFFNVIVILGFFRIRFILLSLIILAYTFALSVQSYSTLVNFLFSKCYGNKFWLLSWKFFLLRKLFRWVNVFYWVLILLFGAQISCVSHNFLLMIKRFLKLHMWSKMAKYYNFLKGLTK